MFKEFLESSTAKADLMPLLLTSPLLRVVCFSLLLPPFVLLLLGWGAQIGIGQRDLTQK